MVVGSSAGIAAATLRSSVSMTTPDVLKGASIVNDVKHLYEKNKDFIMVIYALALMVFIAFSVV